MSKSYYFLVSSLPHIALGEPPEISLEAFISICEEHLTNGDMNALLTLAGTEGASSKHRFLQKLEDKEVLLRNAIVRKRAERLRREATDYIRETPDIDSNTEQAVDTAFSAQNPLEREMAIDKIRFNLYDEIATLDPFTSDSVLAYAAKLKIAERWAALNRNEGQQIAKEIVNRNPNNKTAEAASLADQEN